MFQCMRSVFLTEAGRALGCWACKQRTQHTCTQVQLQLQLHIECGAAASKELRLGCVRDAGIAGMVRSTNTWIAGLELSLFLLSLPILLLLQHLSFPRSPKRKPGQPLFNATPRLTQVQGQDRARTGPEQGQNQGVLPAVETPQSSETPRSHLIKPYLRLRASKPRGAGLGLPDNSRVSNHQGSKTALISKQRHMHARSLTTHTACLNILPETQIIAPPLQDDYYYVLLCTRKHV